MIPPGGSPQYSSVRIEKDISMYLLLVEASLLQRMRVEQVHVRSYHVKDGCDERKASNGRNVFRPKAHCNTVTHGERSQLGE